MRIVATISSLSLGGESAGVRVASAGVRMKWGKVMPLKAQITLPTPSPRLRRVFDLIPSPQGRGKNLRQFHASCEFIWLLFSKGEVKGWVASA